MGGASPKTIAPVPSRARLLGGDLSADFREESIKSVGMGWICGSKAARKPCQDQKKIRDLYIPEPDFLLIYEIL
jgi:hypothetical protein